MKDLIDTLRREARAEHGVDPIMSKMLNDAAEEIERCHARLEITHVYRLGQNGVDDFIRMDVPYKNRFALPDAIEARDVTIALMTKHLERLEKKRG